MRLNFSLHDRSKKMVEGSLFQGVSSLLTNLTRLALVVILIRYYSKEEFGLWGTITSSSAVIATSDFGIVNALRNKMSKLVVLGEEGIEEGRIYFFASFYFFLALAIVLSGTVYCLSTILPFESLFKTDNVYLKEQGVSILLWIQFLFFINMPFGLGGPLFFSFQEAKFSAILSFSQSTLSFINVLLLVGIKSDIVTISIVYFSTNIFVSLFGTVFFLFKRRWFNFKIQPGRFFGIIKELVLVGWKFMGLQLSNSYLQNIGVLLSSAILGVSVAGDFSIVQKLYTFGMGIYVSMLNPIWGGYADAYARNDKVWCKQILSRSILFTFVYFVALLIGITVLGNTAVKMIGSGQYNIAHNVYFFLGLLTLSIALFDCSSLIQNAINKINIKLTMLVISSVIVIPVCKNIVPAWGLPGLTIGLTVMWGVMALIAYAQSRLIIYKTSE